MEPLELFFRRLSAGGRLSGIGGEPPLPFLSLSSAAAAVFRLGSDFDMEQVSVSIFISCTRGRSLGESKNKGH